MITLITGAPGTGKSNAVVSMLEGFVKERAVYVFGIPDLKIKHQALDDPTTWPDSVPDGSVIVLDEVQNVWRPRGPGQKVPDHVSKLETHRHRGLDFYVITQGPNLVDSNVRALTGRHVHLRDLGILGRWWYEWPECADNCRTAWKNAPIKKRYRLDKSAQSKYKSASIHVKPVRSIPWMLVVMVIALVLVGVMTWKSYGAINAKMHPKGLDGDKPSALASGLPVAPVAPQPTFIDDRVAWVPRVSNRPESAPAFDQLRKVAVMPVVAGGLCSPKGCKCYTQQATDAGLSDAECRDWVNRRPFDPYTPNGAVGGTASGYTPTGQGSPDAAPAAIAAGTPSPYGVSFDVGGVAATPAAQRL